MLRVSTMGADASWFEVFREKYEEAFLKRVEEALTKIEDSGTNLGEIFSALPVREDLKQAA